MRLLALGLIGLNLAAPSFSEATAWGIWPMTYLPVGWRWGLALAAVLLVFCGERVWQWARPALAAAAGRLPFSARTMHLIVALLAAVPFVLFRIRHLRWGDAYIFFVAIPRSDIRLTYVWQAPLDVFIHAKAWQLGNRLFGWPDPIPVYLIISTLCGVAFVWILLRLATWLGRNRTERVLTVGLVLTLGMLELFFGYIENYSMIAVGVLLYAWLALRTVRGEIGMIWPATVLAITHATHPATIILAPSLLYLAWVQGRGRAGGARARGFWRAVLTMTIPYVLVFAGVVALMSGGRHGLDALLGVDFPGGGDRRWFVPLFQITTKWEHYTMFSLGHLIDIVNEQLLVAPAIVPGLALAAIFAWPRLPRRDPVFRLLALITGLYFLLTLTWNPDYGGQKDWDLFSGPATPAALWLAYILPRVLPERQALRGAGWALISAQAFHLGAWIYQNTLPLPR
jgi:hypothetical protein